MIRELSVNTGMYLIPLLKAAQDRHGFLSEPVLRELALEANVPLHRLQQLVSFYPHFRTAAPPRVELAVCRDLSCRLACHGDPAARWQSLADETVHVHEVSCIGRCDQAPVGLLNDQPIVLKDLDAVRGWVTEPTAAPEFPYGPTRRWLNDPYSEPKQHYSAFRSTIVSRQAEIKRIVQELQASGLRGMGGAGFPTGKKWALVQEQPRPEKYVICNADESEPGTFKDALILRDQPHLVVEGMLLAGITVGATAGIIFLRHEYEQERQKLQQEIDRARAAGLIGPNAFGRDKPFELTLFVSPGGYILGEETALLECLEDRRGEPRNKPPFPVSHGLFGKPTLINNVETLANVPGIICNGADWWRSLGAADGFPGLKFIAVSGDVAEPGVYQIPLGTTAGELIELAGGVIDGKPLFAFAPGGASSNFLPADQAGVRLDFQELAKAGSMLGSGAMVVLAEGRDLLDAVTAVARFFRNESCGKCVPCRVGSAKAVELLENVLDGKEPRQSLQLLPELGETMGQTSICGLGQVAIGPVVAALKTWKGSI